MPKVSESKFLAGAMLLAWQAAALVLGFVGQADSLLAIFSDPAWLVAFFAAVVAPPSWVAVLASTAGAALVAWSFLQRKDAP